MFISGVTNLRLIILQKTAGFIMTCGDIGVKHSPVLQGPSVPAAHSVAFLWKVGLVAFFQHRLGVLGWTLRRMQEDSK